MTTRELRANRRLTRAYVQASPVTLTLTPYSRVRDDQGGWRFEKGDPRERQQFRLIEYGQLDTPVADGRVRTSQFQILGEYCTEIEVYDRFVHDGIEYRVTKVWPENGWEKRATAERHED